MMTPIEALQIALKRENQSEKLYADWAAKHPAIRELCTALAGEEQQHAAKIRKRLAEIEVN